MHFLNTQQIDWDDLMATEEMYKNHSSTSHPSSYCLQSHGGEDPAQAALEEAQPRFQRLLFEEVNVVPRDTPPNNARG
jgi:hypothetical protein